MAQVTFPTYLGGSGNTYSDDDNPNTGLANDGHRVRFVPLCAEVLAMGLYVYQYAAKIDNAAANADRAEDARGYVEAVADQYQINILEQFRYKATFDLDFDRGIYRIDSGQSVASTNIGEILAVSRTTPKWVEGADGLLREVPPNELAREWRNGKPLGIRAEGPRTNRLLRNETFDGIPWGLFSSASVQTEIGVGNPKSLNGDCVLFSSDGSGINNRIQQNVSGLTVGNVFSAGVYAKKKEGGAGGRFRMSVVSEAETNLDGNKTFEADDEWRFYPFSGVSSESDVNFMIRELDSACDIYIGQCLLSLGQLVLLSRQVHHQLLSVGILSPRL
ncbi:phage head spike fiber domain-containing protein [Vreelandella venusta]|uniref:Uncharacterized protein n=1 Tax=Vreelandella venusta TaxID=44935 RepID=A0AAP9ZFY3_9GAMM|nr:hypothetical protein [Halomonas venusta]QRL05121.1 hypothetical protein JDS37_09400 [Halomonas venusta]GEK50887.1 hypothetical protein HVE01_16080 [Halomonas venusta]